ncbi:hypothetical protein JCM10207_000540 [Rhodosporidiobolus poonsookiae]
MSSVLRVGIVGCGEVAQTTHLPTLQLLSHLYKVTALCDVSPSFLNHCATKFGITSTYSDFSDLVKDSNVDLIVILTADEYHADYAVQAADAGKHVLVEKPMSLTHKDTQAVIAAQERNPNVTIFHGTMRRYAGAFVRMKEELKSLSTISHVVVRDIIGLNSFFVNESGTFPQAFTDFPPESGADRAARGKAMVEAAIGAERAANPQDNMTWRLLGGLGSHDLSAMRELLGTPKRCIAATRSWQGGLPFITALFDYDGFTAVYETGIDKVASFDAFIEVIGDGKRLKLEYDTPYVKGLPITLSIKETDAQGHYTERTIRPTYKDAYTLEYEYLHDAISTGKPVKSDPKDAEQDLVVFDQIFAALVN